MLETFLDHIKQFTSNSITTIIGALLVFIIGTLVVRTLSKLLARALSKANKMDKSLQGVIVTVIKIGGVIVLLLICAEMLSIPTTSLVTLLGTLGLAISLSLQDAVSNIAGGIFIMTSRPFATGNWIEAGALEGEVSKIGLIHTVVTTGNNQKIHIPNSKLMNENIINYSTEKQRRIALTIPVSYESSTKEARKIIYDILCADERIFKTPEPFVRLWDLADSSVNFMVRVWVKSSDYWEVRSDILERIKCAFDENGISIPYNQLTVSFLDKEEKN